MIFQLNQQIILELFNKNNYNNSLKLKYSTYKSF